MSSSGIGPQQESPGPSNKIDEIERIRWEEKKKTPGDFTEDSFASRQAGVVAYLLFLFEKAIFFLKQSIGQRTSAISATPVRETLLLIKAALETMMREDRSQDAPFLKELSHLWQQLLEHSIKLQMGGPLTKKFKTLIKDIETYPNDEDHTFGYYLEEYAGQKWLPFPYMDLLYKLHHQHALDPSSSLLTRWTRMIQDILIGE